MERYREDANRIKESLKYVPIKVLVWGPGDPGPGASPEKIRAYEKRTKIKDVLDKEFSRGEVHFSEDEEMQDISSWISGNLRKEVFQAMLADFIIMLDISRGVDLELDHFVPTYPWFREKAHVFLPDIYVPPAGLAKEVFDYLKPIQVEGFSNDEFNECTLATTKAVRAALSAALALYASGP